MQINKLICLSDIRLLFCGESAYPILWIKLLYSCTACISFKVLTYSTRVLFTKPVWPPHSHPVINIDVHLFIMLLITADMTITSRISLASLTQPVELAAEIDRWFRSCTLAASNLIELLVFSVTPFKIDQNKKSKSFNRINRINRIVQSLEIERR